MPPPRITYCADILVGRSDVRAVMYHGPGDVRLEDVPDPEPGPGQLLVRVATSGVCGTDVGEFVHEPLFFPVGERHPHSGHLGPTIPGHEFSGWVAALGPGVEGFETGDLVAVGAGVSCGHCPPCRSDNTSMCHSYWTVGLHSHGGLAEMAAVPASCTLNLSDSTLTPDLAALAQPMSIAVHATRRGRVGPNDRVTVLGAGGIGSFVTYAAARTGAEVTAVDLDPAKLAVASRLGAVQVLDASAPDFEQTLADTVDPTVVFECTARPESLIRGLGVLAENGRMVVVGHQAQPVSIDFRLVSMRELEIIGTMAHVFTSDFPQGADLIASDPEAWVEVAPTVYPLQQVVEVGLIPMAQGQAPQIKVLFDPGVVVPRPLRTSI